MADFVQTMKDWRRLCAAMESMRPRDSCNGCPLEYYGCPAVYENDNAEVDLADVANKIARWAEENPPLVYETWLEFVKRYETGARKSDDEFIYWMATTSIPADVAKPLGVEPKEER